MAREKDIFKKEWHKRRIEVVDIDNTWYGGRIKSGTWGPKSLVFVKLAGILASTGQPASSLNKQIDILDIFLIPAIKMISERRADHIHLRFPSSLPGEATEPAKINPR